MERDLNLIREIVLDLRTHGYRTSDYGQPRSVVDYHMWLLYDGGLVEGGLHLTETGREFADLARSDTVWKKAWKRARERGMESDVSFPVFLDLLKHFRQREAA